MAQYCLPANHSYLFLEDDTVPERFGAGFELNRLYVVRLRYVHSLCSVSDQLMKAYTSHTQ